MDIDQKINDLKENDLKLLRDLEKKYIKETGKQTTTKKRQKSFGPKTITKVLISGLQEYINDNNLQANWDRNRKMIELSKEMIPRDTQKQIYLEYKKCGNNKNNFAEIQKYLGKMKFRSLLDRVQDFI